MKILFISTTGLGHSIKFSFSPEKQTKTAIHHISRLKDRNHMITSVETENALSSSNMERLGMVGTHLIILKVL